MHSSFDKFYIDSSSEDNACLFSCDFIYSTSFIFAHCLLSTNPDYESSPKSRQIQAASSQALQQIQRFMDEKNFQWKNTLCIRVYFDMNKISTYVVHRLQQNFSENVPLTFIPCGNLSKFHQNSESNPLLLIQIQQLLEGTK